MVSLGMVEFGMIELGMVRLGMVETLTCSLLRMEQSMRKYASGTTAA